MKPTIYSLLLVVGILSVGLSLAIAQINKSKRLGRSYKCMVSGNLIIRKYPPSGYFNRKGKKVIPYILKRGEVVIVEKERHIRGLFGSESWIKVKNLPGAKRKFSGWVYNGYKADGRRYLLCR